MKTRMMALIVLVAIIVGTIAAPVFSLKSNTDSLDKEEQIKYNSNSDYSDDLDEDDDCDEADEAFLQIEEEEEEEYIASLVSSMSEKETTTADWEYNLNFLKSYYNKIKDVSKKKRINMKHVDSYIEAYEIVLLLKDSPDEKVASENRQVAAVTSFDFLKAVDYAKKYYKTYNTAYPDWGPLGGDCANFISQCLYAGGFPMEGVPGTASSAGNFANWFSKGTETSTVNVSSTWRGADAFRSYWQSHSIGYKKFTSYTDSAWAYGFRGYAVSLLNSNGRAYHTMIVVNYNYTTKDLICGCHTGSSITRSLKNTYGGYGFILYKTW